MTLSELIRYYRASEHLSLEAIGDYVGVAKSTVKRWENQKTYLRRNWKNSRNYLALM